MVLVEPRKHHNFSKVNFFRRHSYSGSVSMINNGIEEIQPAVDFPVQFNFGSPYSSSLTVFFDFEGGYEYNREEIEDIHILKEIVKEIKSNCVIRE